MRFLIIVGIFALLWNIFVTVFGDLVIEENPYADCLQSEYSTCYTTTQTKKWILYMPSNSGDRECIPYGIGHDKYYKLNNGCTAQVVGIPKRVIDEDCMKRKRNLCEGKYLK